MVTEEDTNKSGSNDDNDGGTVETNPGDSNVPTGPLSDENSARAQPGDSNVPTES